MKSLGDEGAPRPVRAGHVIAVVLVAPIALIFTVAIGMALVQGQPDKAMPFALHAATYWAFAGACWFSDI